MPKTLAVRLHPSHTARLTRILNEQAAAGMTCVSLTNSFNKVTLELEPTAPDAPLHLWLAVPWEAFYQPTGWDYALHSDRYVLYTRPLPAGTVTERPQSSLRKRLFAEEAVTAEWLTEQARVGKQFVAMWQGMGYFVPAAPAEVAYTLTPPNPDDPHAVTGASDIEANNDGLFFIAATDTADIFADHPGQVPPHHGEKVPYDLWKPAMRKARLAYNRTMRRVMMFLLSMIVVIPLIGFLCGFSEKEITMMLFLGAFVMGIAVLLVIVALRLYQKSDAGRLLDTCHSPKQYPRHPPSTTKNTSALLHAQRPMGEIGRLVLWILGAIITVVAILSQLPRK